LKHPAAIDVITSYKARIDKKMDEFEARECQGIKIVIQKVISPVTADNQGLQFWQAEF